MSYLLDTNVVVRHLNGRAPQIMVRMSQQPRSTVFISAVLRSELEYGAERRGMAPERYAVQEAFLAQFLSLPFDDGCARIAGSLRAALERAGEPIGPYDLLIAAIALAHGLTLVTHNTREFARVPGLVLEDWETD